MSQALNVEITVRNVLEAPFRPGASRRGGGERRFEPPKF